ncbi:hypothetical protein KJA15_03565 [Patescibacteria group bacterium]|nr:hypothetical protein [Patescibacteria group bacterium]
MPFKDKDYAKAYAREYARKYRIEHREDLKAKHRKYYEEHREECLKKSKIYYRKHRNRYRENYKTYRQKLRIQILKALGGKCFFCGCSDFRLLQIDHIQDNGNEDRNFYKHNDVAYYKNILASFKKNEGKYQLLCANCHVLKTLYGVVHE